MTPGKMMAHATWLRMGLADAPGSPFHVLGLTEDAVSPSPRWNAEVFVGLTCPTGTSSVEGLRVRATFRAVIEGRIHECPSNQSRAP